MKAWVSGACGFVGSHLVDRLIADGWEVVGFDNLSTGFDKFANPKMELVKGDIRDMTSIVPAMAGADTVFHLSANADIRGGWEDPTRDLKQNILATSNVLEAMRITGVKRIAFASSDAVYGESQVIPTPEDCPWPVQTSLYAASKVASESLIQAYCAGQGFHGFIFRFCPVVGERYTHGHIFDFVKRLLADPTRLEVKGNGEQRKCKMYVGDLVDAVMHIVNNHEAKTYNVTVGHPTSISDSVAWISDEMGLTPDVRFTDAKKVWIGDLPLLWPSWDRLLATGWFPNVTTEEGVRRTVRWLLANKWALEERT